MTLPIRSLHPSAVGAAALIASALTSSAAAQADLDLLAVTGQPIPGTTTQLVAVTDLSAGAEGGWAARGLIDPTPATSEAAIIGDLSADASQGVSVLRRPMLLGGFQQVRLGMPDPFGTQVGYLASNDGGLLLRYQAAFIDDQMIARQGDPVGATGRQWGLFRRIVLRPGGRVFLRAGSSLGAMLYARHSDTVLISVGDPVPTMSGPITNIGRFDISPDGMHWAAIVTAGSNRKAILVDGSLLMLGGNPVVQQRAISPTLGLGSGDWADFFGLAIDNAGRVTFQASTSAPVGGAPTIRGESVVQLGVGPSAAPEFHAETPGALGVFTAGPVVFLEDQVVVPAGATIDADGDGLADAGYTTGTSTIGSAAWEIQSVGDALVGTVFVDVPWSTGDQQGVVRFQRGFEGDSTCAGVPNSTGRAASLSAFGRSGAGTNDLTLFCVDLPAGCMGYALGSRQSGFVPNPGGSTGNLCLGGPIGRFIPQMFSVGGAGRGVVELDLTSLPQPTGAVTATAGDIWFFQIWHRDLCSGPGATSNFSNAVSVQLTN